MEKKSIFALVALIVIVILVGTLYFYVQPEPVELPNHDIYEVDDEFDDTRTFTVILNDLQSETEHGDWALLQLSPSYSFGVRFNNITIANNSEILDAYVELYSVGTPGHDHPNCIIYCDNVDNAENFSKMGVLDISGRNYTDSYSIWNSTVHFDQWIKSPSITDSLKEVVYRPNWTNGNSIAVLFVSEGFKGYSAAFQNYEKGFPPKLHIIWREKE